MSKFMIYIGADHRGFALKSKLTDYLKKDGYSVEDIGDDHLDPDDDYPEFAGRCASSVLGSEDPNARGILICGSGQGMCIAANRFKGIRAALGHSAEATRAARNDDDANVLCLPADEVEHGDWQTIADAFVKTTFAAAPRFVRRNREMDNLG
jgi:ribose 5-phosphate isomerase B